MIQQIKSKLAAFHNAVSKKEKKIKPVWFFFLLLLLFASCQEEKKKTIVCWGDSLTAPHRETLKQKIRGIFVEDHDYPSVLQKILGDDYEVINCGVGGENTLTIMGRQGAYPFILAHDVTINSKDCALENFMGNTDVPAFLSSYNNEVCYPLLQHKSSAKINDCMIQGGIYELSAESNIWRVGDGYGKAYNYFITPKVPSDKQIVLKKGSAIHTYAMKNLRNAYCNIIFMGENGGFKDVKDLIKQIKAMIIYSKCNRYIVIGFHKCNAVIPNMKRMYEMEDSLQQAFGKHYLCIRKPLVQKGLQFANLQATKVDEDSVRKGVVPPQLLVDGLHFTSKGYEFIGDLVSQKMKELEY